MHRGETTVRRSVAARFERGRYRGALARALAAAWEPLAARSLIRPGHVPSGVAVVCVGGGTLGGSGKTRVVLSSARALLAAGARVVVVGHAFRAALVGARARVVAPDDPLDLVGDEALVCARSLATEGAAVVVARRRQEAIDLALRLAPDVLVVDGPLRLRDARGPSLSLLALDRGRPWGSGALPPAGDLRAPRATLLACADRVVPVDAAPTHVRWREGARSPIASLAGRTVRLFTAIARPDRLARALTELGVPIAEAVTVADHGPVDGASRLRLSSSPAGPPWVATEKCAMHLAEIALPDLGVLSAESALPAPVLRSLKALIHARGCR